MKPSDQLKAIYQRKRAALYSISLAFAGQELAGFRARQPSGSGVVGEFWTNQTSVAADSVFSDAFVDKDDMGWFISHGVDYGVYLELANDRKHEALRPIVEAAFPKFMEAVRGLYAD